ncbi:MAG: N-acetylmuramoyl-L-alanine amidase [Verrucomicrobia bacterium]|nr:N-acetylmuramoyl-L-alanine amidase [Verrucomicrobiota bacterium]MBS0638056.1 N-acetylmuramoyl-L-alanine amidase [Verrucomicrobiota bacterium]
MRWWLVLIVLFTSCARQKPERFSREAIRRPKALPIIILDPGHGGANDGTKMAMAPYIKEKTLALDTALKVRDILEQWGYKVRMTRTRDVFIPLAERVTFAKQHRGYAFISIHFNHAPNKNANGVEIFYSHKSNFTPSSKKLAKDVLDSICKRTQAASRGIHPGDYHVLRENGAMPAILVEGGFFSNVSDAKKLSNPQYIRTLAYSIAQGIDDFVQQDCR